MAQSVPQATPWRSKNPTGGSSAQPRSSNNPTASRFFTAAHNESEDPENSSFLANELPEGQEPYKTAAASGQQPQPQKQSATPLSILIGKPPLCYPAGELARDPTRQPMPAEAHQPADHASRILPMLQPGDDFDLLDGPLDLQPPASHSAPQQPSDSHSRPQASRGGFAAATRLPTGNGIPLARRGFAAAQRRAPGSGPVNLLRHALQNKAAKVRAFVL